MSNWPFVRSYAVSRTLARLRLHRAYSGHKRIVVLLQMGKVGSAAVLKSLRVSEPSLPVLHVHYISDASIDRYRTLYKHTWPEGNTRQLWRCEYLRGRVESGFEGFKFISLVRDPVARNVSSFFQTTDIEVLGDGSGHRLKSLDHSFEATVTRNDLAAYTRLFLEKFTDHDVPATFFEKEFGATLGIDVYSREFPHGAGYEVRSTPHGDLLLLRLEDLTGCIDEAMGEFLGLSQFQLMPANLSRGKSYGEIYDWFKRSVRLPEWYLDRVYGSRFAQYFYTPGELRRFRLQWMGPRSAPAEASERSPAMAPISRVQA